MFVYNVTVKIMHAIEAEWLQWMKEEHIPEVLATNMFHDFKLLHLEEPLDEEGITYIVQYFTNSRDKYQHYIAQFAPGLRNKGFARFGDQFIAFRTFMRIVS